MNRLCLHCLLIEVDYPKTVCIECRKIAVRRAKRKWQREHHEAHLAARRKIDRRRQSRRKVKMAAYVAAYRKRHPDRALATKQLWNRNNRQRINANQRRARLVNPNLRLRHALRGRIATALRAQSGLKSGKTVQMLGCSIANFKIYLESLFEPGMSWDNYGRGGWEVDHIMPCAIFDLTNPEHQKRCFHFSNMQPLWMHDNRTKGAKILATS